MSDYKEILKSYIEGLGATTRAQRSDIYERARRTLAEQFAALPEGQRDKRLGRLESIMAEVEGEIRAREQRESGPLTWDPSPNKAVVATAEPSAQAASAPRPWNHGLRYGGAALTAVTFVLIGFGLHFLIARGEATNARTLAEPARAALDARGLQVARSGQVGSLPQAMAARFCSDACVDGQTLWGLAGGGGPEKRARLIALSTVPDAGISVSFTLERNEFLDVRASYLATLRVTRAADRSGVRDVPGLLFAADPASEGEPLAAAAVSLGDGKFVIALSAGPENAKRDTNLMRGGRWLEIPVALADGRSAMIYIEKGYAGSAAFDAVLSFGEARDSK